MIIITSDYGSFPHSLLSTSKIIPVVLHKAVAEVSKIGNL